MSTGAGATKLATSSHEEILAGLRNRTQAKATPVQKEQDSRFAKIEENVFFKTLFNPNLSPDQKTEEAAKILTFADSKETMRDRVAQLENFKEYLQEKREEMAKSIIEVTNTEAFGELKKNFDHLNEALLQFDEKIKPLTDITDAIYTVRTNNKMDDVFREIKEDKAREAALVEQRKDIINRLSSIKNEIEVLTVENITLGNDTGWFGGIKKESKIKIDLNTNRIATLRDDLINLETDMQALQSKTAESNSQLAEFASEKEKIRQLTDISSEGHKQRQKELVEATLHFITESKERIGSVRNQLGQVDKQVDNLGDAAGKMSMVYATLNDAITKAEIDNQKIREELMVPEGEESTVKKMARQSKENDVLSHIALLDRSKVDTQITFGDLMTQTQRVRTMKEAIVSQSADAKTLHTQGIAGMADRLSVVLQAVSSAALGESSAVAKDTLRRMAESTNKISQKETIRVAMGIQDVNEDILTAMQDLESYNEITKAATQITSEGVASLRTNLEQFKKIAQDAESSLRENIAVHSDVFGGVAKAGEEILKPETKTNDPFKI